MGWVESPSYFTAVAERACDLLNATLRLGPPRLAPHPLEAIAATPPTPPPRGKTGRRAWRIPARQCHAHLRWRPGTCTWTTLYWRPKPSATETGRVMRAALYSIDRVLRPRTADDRPSRKEPVSVKKLLQGDACWATQKTILGWDLDTVAGTMRLPPHRVALLYSLLDAYPRTRRRVPIAEWQQLLGELRSMSAALPGPRGLFSTLQDALRKGDRHRIRLSRSAFDSLHDFRLIADSLSRRPTRFRELVPVGDPLGWGACDACQRGMGGVWFARGLPPVVWRAPFPAATQRALITSDNRHGALSISDLELSGLIAHTDVLVHMVPDAAERPVWLAGDNLASLSWATKGSATSSTARAYLLRLNALHQRQNRYVAQHDHIAGTANVMADNASRRWDLSDSVLLSHFDFHYPQATSWIMRTLPASTHSALIGALSRRRCTPTSLQIASSLPPTRGACGSDSAHAPELQSTSTTSRATLSPSFSSSPTNTALATSPPATGLFALVRWKTRSVTWRRRYPKWGPLTLA